MTDVILVINAGSSSLKFAPSRAPRDGSPPPPQGRTRRIGRQPEFSARDADGAVSPPADLSTIGSHADHGELMTRLLAWLKGRTVAFDPVAAGHRVVHGGRRFTAPVAIDDAVVADLERLVPLAPLHQPINLAAIAAIARLAPELLQVACFDTSFHRSQPRLAQLFALPRRLTDQGLIRYGFHGLSYQYIANVLPEHLGARADGRVVVAHLGNGASMCAMRERSSVATTMGLTALDGLPMGRRSGSIDPGVVLHLLQQEGKTYDEVHRLLYRESGLLGVSGLSNNMQVLLASGEPHAREAIELFCYRAARELGSLAAALGGLDALVFTAGIGENAAEVRRLICERSAWLGIELDAAANARNAPRVSTAGSPVDVRVIPTDEESVIADAVRKIRGRHT